MAMDGIIPFAMIGSVQQMVSNMGSGFTVKGVVAASTDLPATGELGDLYLVSGEGYTSYIWDGDSWELKDGQTASDADIQSALYT